MTPRLSAFLVVGAFGFGVQMVALFALASRWQVPYALATAVAVEAAVYTTSCGTNAGRGEIVSSTALAARGVCFDSISAQE